MNVSSVNSTSALDQAILAQILLQEQEDAAIQAKAQGDQNTTNTFSQPSQSGSNLT